MGQAKGRPLAEPPFLLSLIPDCSGMTYAEAEIT